MPLMPAHCFRCGLTFQPQGGIYIEGATNISMSNNTTNCPRCGGMATFVDGNFDVVDGAIRMNSGPQWSLDVIIALRLTLEQIIERPPGDPLARIAEVDPAVAEAINDAVDNAMTQIERPSPKKRRKIILQVLQGILTLLSFDAENAVHNVDDIRRAIVALLQYVAEHGVLPPR